jgi:hypothetical protein
VGPAPGDDWSLETPHDLEAERLLIQQHAPLARRLTDGELVGRSVTGAAVAGTCRTQRIRPGAKSTLRVVITMRRWVRNGKIIGLPVRTLPQYTTTSTGVRKLIPGDVVKDAVESYPYDVVPAVPQKRAG